MLFPCCFSTFFGTCVRALILIIILSGGLRAQYVQHPIEFDRVIAASGLNLRAQPTTKSRVIKTLPYLSKVDVVDHVLLPRTENNAYDYEKPRVPLWVQVAAGRDTGYVSNAYLYRKTRKRSTFSPQMNQDYVLAGHRYDAWPHPEHHQFSWYGLYDTLQQQRPVRASYVTMPNEIEGTETRMSATDERGLWYFIGSRKPLSPSVVPILFTNFYNIHDTLTQQRNTAALADVGITLAPSPDTTSHAPYADFVLTRNGRTQRLVLPDGSNPAKFLKANGDFDGDGRTDFILSYSFLADDLTDVYVLWLSSAAGPGELVAPVACFWDYFGC